MKVVAISDLHGHLPKIPSCDLLLIAGDLCPMSDIVGQRWWLQEVFGPWLESLDVKDIIGVAGNHDWIFERAKHLVPKLPWTYLEDNLAEVQGLTIYGIPWQRRFYDWAFNLDEPELGSKYAKIPEGVDIIVSHGPPFYFGDLTKRGEHVGCRTFIEKVQEIKPKLVVFGHIHCDHGQWDYEDCKLANVTVVNEKYEMVYEPLVFDL